MATAAKKTSTATKTTAKSTAKTGIKAPSAKTAKPRAKKAAAAPPPVVEHVSAYKDGNRVTHPVFGDGKVISILRDQLTIQFGSQERVILESFVKPGPKG
ncbi:MAG: hypothetical protein ABL907_15470 [Hyphomicrobium sp.]